MLKRRYERDPKLMWREINAERSKTGAPAVTEEAVTKVAKQAMPFLIEALRINLPALGVALKAQLPNLFRKAAKSAQNRVLAQDSIPERRLAVFEGLIFRVERPSNGGTILGDSAVLFEVNGKKRFKTFLEKDDELLSVYLPLATGTWLIGSRDKSDVDFEKLRLQIARCSLEYFISAVNDRKRPPGYLVA